MRHKPNKFPKRVIRDSWTDPTFGDTYVRILCPTCNKRLPKGYEKYKYCPYCSQRIISN